MEPPDREERVIRFGCGALFGVTLALMGLLYFSELSWPWLFGITCTLIGACGYGAMRQGDQFWDDSFEVFRFPWWW